MKFIVNSQVLLKQLQSISGVITTNNTVPIISCFLFHLDDGVLTVRATDLETTIVLKISVETNSLEGLNDVAIQSRLLLDILKSLDDVPVTFTLDDTTYAVEISTGAGNYSLAGMDASVFPQLPEIDEAARVSVPASALVSAINKHGGIAVGLNGADARIIQAETLDASLGRVGRVSKVDTTLIEDLLAADYIPVIATVGFSDDGDFNINADTVAGEIAAAIGAQKIVFITDVDGIYVDFSDKDTLIGRMALAEAVELAESGTMSKGMIPKINACVTALSAGVKKAHIINGTSPHALVLEIFTVDGVGTMVMRQMGDDFDPQFVEAPVSNFASKLSVGIQTLGH